MLFMPSIDELTKNYNKYELTVLMFNRAKDHTKTTCEEILSDNKAIEMAATEIINNTVVINN